MRKISILNLAVPECYVIFLHFGKVMLFQLNLTPLKVDLVVVQHSLGKTENIR